MINIDDLPIYAQPASDNNIILDPGQTLPDYLARIERKVILDTYDKYHNTTKVAKALGISQSSVSVKLKKYTEENSNKT